MNVADGGNQKDEFCETAGPLLHALHGGHEHAIEHLLRHSPDAGIDGGDTLERAVVFDDAEPKLRVKFHLGTVTFQIPEPGECRGPLGDGLAFDLLEVGGGPAREVVEEQFIWSTGAVDFLDAVEDFQSQLIAAFRIKRLAFVGEPIEFLRPAIANRASPGVEPALLLKVITVLFDAHVAHLERASQFGDGHAGRSLEEVYNGELLGLRDVTDGFEEHVVERVEPELLKRP